LKESLIFEAPILCLITPGDLVNEDFTSAFERLLETIRSAVSGGVSLIQIREKELSAKNLDRLVSQVVCIVQDSATRIIVNDRADVAAAGGADGVQLTEVSLAVGIVRSSFPDLLIGASTHSIPSIKTAAEQGADFALFGPVFPTPGKENAQGLRSLASASKAVPGFPVLGVGGVDETNYRQVLSTGVSGFAAIRSLNNIESLRSITVALFG